MEDGKLIFVRENDFHLYKHMYLPELNEVADHNNFAVLGHIQPKGGFFPVVEMQARYFFDVLSEKAELKSTFLMKASLEKKRCEMSIEYVKTKRHTQIVSFCVKVFGFMADRTEFPNRSPDSVRDLIGNSNGFFLPMDAGLKLSFRISIFLKLNDLFLSFRIQTFFQFSDLF